MKLRTLGWLMFSRQGWVAAAAARQWTRFMSTLFLTRGFLPIAPKRFNPALSDNLAS